MGPDLQPYQPVDFSDDLIESFASRLAEFEKILPDKERQILHAMIYKLLDPVDRIAFRSGDGVFTEEEQQLLEIIDQETKRDV